LRFPGFNDEWKNIRLGDLCDLITKGTTPSKFVESGIKFIKIESFDNNDINSQKCLFIDEFTHNKTLKRSRLEENDILFAIAGATIGKVNLVKKSILPANTNQALAILRLKKQENHQFILQVLKSPVMEKYIKESISVGAQPNLNLEQMNNFSFSIPSLKEQEKISNFLVLVNERIETQNKIIEQLESLIKAIGQYLFNQNKFEFNQIKLGEICEIKKGEQINGSELTEFGQYPVINGGITPSGFHSKYNCNANTITISEGGNSCGFVQFMKRQFWSGGHCYSLNSMNENVQNKYLFYFLKYSESKIMSLRVGSGLPNIQRNAISNFDVFIPNKQTQILTTNVLDAINSKWESEIAVLNLFKNQKNYFLNKMFK
jgi:type I restriction enzyme S subunit